MKIAVQSGPAALGGALPLPTSVRLLADHLDAVLAMAEDLSSERLDLGSRQADDPRPTGMHALVASQRQLGEFVRAVRTLELAMVARLIQARKLAGDLRRSHPSLRPLVQLFHAGTIAVEQAVADVGKGRTETFGAGEAAMEFLRSRLIIDPTAPGLVGLDAIVVDERTMLLGQLRLGTLMDLVATFLDKLDDLFDLYPDATASGLAVGADEDGEGGASVPLEHAPDLADGVTIVRAAAEPPLAVSPDDKRQG